jgi:hypothetical protein
MAVAETASATSWVGGSGATSGVRAPRDLVGLPPRGDQPGDRRDQQDGEHDHALGQDGQLLDRAVEHGPARVRDAGAGGRGAQGTGIRRRPGGLADHLERPAHGRAAQERVARADPQAGRRRAADGHGDLLGLQPEAELLVLVADREPQVRR